GRRRGGRPGHGRRGRGRIADLAGGLVVVPGVAQVVPLLRPLLRAGWRRRVPDVEVPLARQRDDLVQAVAIDVTDGRVGDVPAAGPPGPAGRVGVGLGGVVYQVARRALDVLVRRRTAGV